MSSRWIQRGIGSPETALGISKTLGVSRFVAELLVKRGVSDAGAAEAFLNPKLANLKPPELLPEMDKAVDRILHAMERKERIVLYGDYDVDGVSSLALLSLFLRECGSEVRCFLPRRASEGYGLGMAAVARCIDEHSPRLLVAIDCGTNSYAEISSLKDAGIDVIVLDHHEPSGPRPPCVALVNPKCGADFHYLCSAGVAFKFAHAILKKRPNALIDLRGYLDLVALATVADIVPLLDENRIFVSHGLQRMSRSRWHGLRALRDVAGVDNPIRSSDIGFRMGPRIDAAGRLGPANDALDLLLSNNDSCASRLALALDAHNRQRQAVEQRVAREVDEWVGANFNPDRDTTIVASNRDWHIGVLGVVASKIMRKYHRPTFIIGFDENGEGKGSGRSIEGMPLVELLSGCSSHLIKFGGHNLAAGISISEGAVAGFRSAFELAARDLAASGVPVSTLELDCEIDLSSFEACFLDLQEMLEPFGASNPQPVFFSRGVVPSSTPRVMKEKHLRLEFPAGRSRIQAVFFNAPIESMPRPPWDIAFMLDRNEWAGRSEPQLRILEVRSAE